MMLVLSNFSAFPVQQMRLPSKPYSSLPIYSIGSTNTLPRERLGAAGQALSVAGRPTSKEAPPGASKGAGKASGAAGAAKAEKSSVNPQRHGIQKTMSK